VTVRRSHYIQRNLGGVPERVSLSVRRRQLERLVELCRIGKDTSVLDVGVTHDERADSNFMEKLYPYPHRLVAVGMEDISAIAHLRGGLKVVRADGTRLPFADRSFDLVTCFATVEHAGPRASQRALLGELCRVGRQVCVTTPNRWYPFEFHTLLPLLHWLPPAMFRAILSWGGREFFAREENLNLLSERALISLLPPGVSYVTSHSRLLGLVSNLFIVIRPS
jgi:Methyltransferase domain